MIDRRVPVTCSPCLVGSHDCAGACACPRCHPRLETKTVAASQPTPKDGFDSVTVCKVSGITFRQLDYWVRTGLVRPSIAESRGSGTKRVFSDGDLRMLCVIKRLLDAGTSLQAVRKALPLGREPEGLRWLVVSDREPIMCLGGELERICREIGVCTVIDLEGQVLPLPA